MILGAVTYRIIIALVLRLGMPADDLKLFTALTVVVALFLPRIKEMRSHARYLTKGNKHHADH